MKMKPHYIAPGLAFIATIILTAIALQIQGRIWLPASGDLFFWVSDAWSDQNSQHITDPYSFSHFQHGLVFFALFFTAKRLTLAWKFVFSMVIESLWEIAENSAAVINRYREAGALGYSGDTIINSLGDLFYCALGFVIAYYIGLRKSLMIFIIIEIIMIMAIRDSLLLNVIMLIHPVEAIESWQSVMRA